MRRTRYSIAVLTASATLGVTGGVAVAGSGDGNGDRAARCSERLAKAAERRGVSVEQLEATVRTRLLARIDDAEKAGRIASERATALRERIEDASLCGARKHVRARLAAQHLLRAAAEFLGIERGELREELHGTSLASLAAAQGKSEADLEAAMLAPAKERLAKAVADGKLAQTRADAILERLEKVAGRLANRVFQT